MKSYVTRQSQAQSDDIYVRLLQQLTKDKLYLNPDVTAGKLSVTLRCAPRNISAAVQVCTNNNFCHLLNSLRLREVCRRLQSPRYAGMTVEDIGLSCGYKSRQAFYVAFNRHMGCTPLAWLEQNANPSRHLQRQ